MVIEHRSSSQVSKPNQGVASTDDIIRQRATSYNLKAPQSADKKDFAQYGKMISIEEYSLAVILYNRKFAEARRDRNGSRAARMFELRR
ncbi:hypothetical protein [Rhizobium leguminosarum]|uniref:hypothetical protein n=1 Tax=Rhizobium leguminosarum TaxID=384 RepID=UPI001C955D09|nr:hypothetical protein [Rhizobium leguminosarum]MBY5725789.1 hypothetical protein [Rhizobium leguminosarum]